MNPFRAIYQSCRSHKMLRDYGFTGDLLTMVRQSLTMHEAMMISVQQAGAAMDTLNQAVQDGRKAEAAARQSETVLYFVPYHFSVSQHWNGGRQHSGHGMACMTVREGVRDWNGLMEIKRFIERDMLKAHTNPIVDLTGIFELNRWPT